MEEDVKLNGKKVLVVDDNDMIREVMVDLLSDEGYTMLEAENGLLALNVIEKEHIDLIITDIFMPDEDGIGTIFKLKKNFPDIKIIAISGGGQIKPDSYLEMAEMLGAIKTFTKPFDTEELLQYVNSLFGK